MAQNPGAFIRINEKNIELVIKGCTNLLQNLNRGPDYINGLKYDENFGGFKVYFSDDSVVADFMKQNFLPLSEKMATIHPLTTSLVVHNVFPPIEDEFKELIKSQFFKLKLQPILDINFIPVSPSYPALKTGDWLINLDIPEIQDMNLFKNIGLPDSMKLMLNLRTNAPNQEVKVSFFCPICNKVDHSRLHCPSFIDFIDISEDSPKDFTFIQRSPPTFEIQDRSQNNGTSSFTSKSAKKHSIDAIASDLGRKKIQLSTKTPLIKEKEIKKEPLEEIIPTSSRSDFGTKRSLENTDNKDGLKKIRLALETDNLPELDDTMESNPISTTDKDNSKLDYHSANTSYLINSYLDESGYSYDSPNDEYGVSNSNFPTSSEPETSSSRYRIGDLQAREDANDHSDSNESFKAPRRMTRKKPIYAPVVLPSRIREIVLSSKLKEGELPVEKLEAFFNHVKKKMSPAKIAKQFTADAEVLKQQLISIKQQYYMTPKAGSGEDSRFMKWLEGMLERFDSTPSKRKK